MGEIRLKRMIRRAIEVLNTDVEGTGPFPAFFAEEIIKSFKKDGIDIPSLEK